MDINRNNYETFFLLYLDRELKPEEVLKVEKFLTENPDLQKEFAILKQTILLPFNMVFESKASLLHEEGKRRMIPFYRMRVAAAIALVMLTGWLIATRVVKNHRGEVAVSRQPVEVKKNPVLAYATDNGRINRTQKEEISVGRLNTADSKPTEGADGLFIVTRKQHKLNIRNKKDEVNPQSNRHGQNTDTEEVPDEPVLAVEKSSADVELQAADMQTGSAGQTGSLPAIKSPPLLVSAGHPDNTIKNEKAGLKDQDFQTDEAISVVALNDHNKTITGFFKKLIRRTPEEENARKLHVSVFQISY
jgi:hypothetical protein